MSRRFGIVLVLFVLAAVAAGILLRPEREGARGRPQGRADRGAEPGEGRDGEARVVLDSAEVARVGIGLAALARARSGRGAASGGRGRRGAGAHRGDPGSGRRSPHRRGASRWPELGARVAAGAALGQVSDARPMVAPIGGVVTRVGARPGEIVAEGQTLLELADRSRPVVRLAWPACGRAAAGGLRSHHASRRGRGRPRRAGRRGRSCDSAGGLSLPARRAWPGAVPAHWSGA